ncbi:MAG: hypothetical protein KGZ58_07580 [Ignavibacteriales bacterium]|nr:hypothetical protein [Ignavibacteriales bacterium]
MKLEDARKQFENEWMAFRSIEKGDNPDGEVILHNKNRREFDNEVLKKEIVNVYLTYNGPVVPEGYAIIF